MENPVREIRQLLKKNQVEFAAMIGRSYASLRAYERHPEDTPADVIERLKTLATENGYADIAVILSSDNWRVRTVIHSPAEFAARRPPPAFVPVPQQDTDRQRFHDLLDEILDSGDPDAVRAVIPNLELFGKWVRGAQPEKMKQRKRK